MRGRERGNEGEKKKNEKPNEQRQRDEPPNSALWQKTQLPQHYTRVTDTARAVR